MHELLKIPPHIVEATLGHISGYENGVAGVYNRSAYFDDRRAALNIYGEHIARLIRPSE
jgi:hypothetical protein